MRIYNDLISEIHNLIAIRDYVAVASSNIRIDKSTAHGLARNLISYDNKIMKLLASNDFQKYLLEDDVNSSTVLQSEKDRLEQQPRNGFVSLKEEPSPQMLPEEFVETPAVVAEPVITTVEVPKRVYKKVKRISE